MSHPFVFQVEDEVVVQAPEISQPVHYATDEEKLASSAIMNLADVQEEKGEPDGSKGPGKKYQPISDMFDMEGESV